jgi:hypothetical protein
MFFLSFRITTFSLDWTHVGLIIIHKRGGNRMIIEINRKTVGDEKTKKKLKLNFLKHFILYQ